MTIKRPKAAATIEIDAPIDVVWRAMIDVSAYHEWNPFIVAVEGVSGAPAVGQGMRLHVRWANGRQVTSNEVFAAIEPPAPASDGSQDGGRVALLEYAFRGPLHTLNLVRGTRIQTLRQSPTVAAGRTVYETTEEFLGWLAAFVPIKQVQDGFDRHSRALKLRAESMASSRQGPSRE